MLTCLQVQPKPTLTAPRTTTAPAPPNHPPQPKTTAKAQRASLAEEMMRAGQGEERPLLKGSVRIRGIVARAPHADGDGDGEEEDGEELPPLM